MIYIHRPQCKDVVVCNIYRPPAGDLKKAMYYLDNCLKTINLAKTDLFLMGNLNVNYRNRSSPNFKKLNTLDHYISDHQPNFVVHKKARDTREKIKFEGRSYRNFDKECFRQGRIIVIMVHYLCGPVIMVHPIVIMVHLG